MNLYLLFVIKVAMAFGFLSQSSVADDGVNSCLERAFSDPRSATMFADFYYETEDKALFAQQFYQRIQEKLSNENYCEVNTKKPAFTCVRGNGAYPVCGAKVDNYYVAVVKDYVDSARLIVNKRPANSYTWIPSEKSKNDNAMLSIPDSSYCYEGILDGSYDSQTYTLDVRPYLPFYFFRGDRRFIMADSLQDLVQSKAEANSRCQLRLVDYPAKEISCKKMAGSAWQACFASPNGGGYFVYTFLHGSPRMHMTFNRWD